MRAKKRPATTSNERLAGHLIGLFGLQGEIKCDPTSAGRTVFIPGGKLLLRKADVEKSLTIVSVRPHKTNLLLRFDGIDDATAAQSLVGAALFASREEFVLEKNEYFDEDLIGCRLIDEKENVLGVVRSIEHYAQDILVCERGRVPLVAEFVRRIDVQGKRIEVTLPPGLLDEAAAYEA